jgi:C4-dicarboxylate-specific signal transduction histidine kinase
LDKSALHFIQVGVATYIGLMLVVFVFLALYLFTRAPASSAPTRATAQPVAAPGELVRLERLALVGWLAPNMLHDLQKPITNIKHEVEDLSLALGNFAGASRSLRNIRDQIALYFDTMSEADIERFVHSDRSDMEYVDINRAIEQALKLVHFERGATVVRLEFTQGLPLVLAHPYQLVQTFATVLLHCYDTLKGRGEVRIATRPENTKQGMFAVAVISDNGPGCSPEYLERLFNPSVTHDLEKNVGIDLAVSRTIAREQGGDLTVTSALNEGTRYTVQLRAGD